MAPKNQPSFPTTPGSKRITYVRKFGRSTKANAPAKCRKARKAAKQEAIDEQNRRNAMSTIEQQREKEAQAAAELEQKARASDRSKRVKKMMAARAKKAKLDRRLYLQKLRKARIAKMNSNTETLWKTNGAEYVNWYLQSFELTSKPVHFMTVPKMLEPLDCKCNKKNQYVDLYMNHWHERVAIEHCECRNLVQSLLLMQMMPSSSCTPRTGIHFGLLDYLHLLKMGSYVSNHSFADITNKSIAMSQIEQQQVSIAFV